MTNKITVHDSEINTYTYTDGEYVVMEVKHIPSGIKVKGKCKTHDTARNKLILKEELELRLNE